MWIKQVGWGLVITGPYRGTTALECIVLFDEETMTRAGFSRPMIDVLVSATELYSHHLFWIVAVFAVHTVDWRPYRLAIEVSRPADVGDAYARAVAKAELTPWEAQVFALRATPLAPARGTRTPLLSGGCRLRWYVGRLPCARRRCRTNRRPPRPAAAPRSRAGSRLPRVGSRSTTRCARRAGGPKALYRSRLRARRGVCLPRRSVA